MTRVRKKVALTYPDYFGVPFVNSIRYRLTSISGTIFHAI
jgi:hypothetical protein